ncbi:uncharacterized protein [Primulina huaijiensis]|uniref:uncharacterized protein n=1 Tax=Primulina huaijiensis TaxID=1492673 RepID=UPI003CC784DC
MGKSVTIYKFFQRKRSNQPDPPISTAPSIPSDDNIPPEVHSQKLRKVESAGVDLNFLERDPGLRRQIWEYSPNEQEEIRRAYLNLKPSECLKQTAFTVVGFDNWKKARSGKTCSFQCHIGKDNVSSPRRIAEKACEDLMNQPQYIPRFFNKISSEAVARNHLRLKVGIHVVRLLALQGVPFRGHDESSNSSNRGNFLEFLDVVALYNDELSDAIHKAPKNPMRVKNVILEEIADNKYCIVIDEARDESKIEQMSIVLRFVDKNGCIQERFFGLVHVSDTTALKLKNAIYSYLSHYNLDVQNIRGQGYDGARNMRGEFNGLQALILKDCKSAYYVHCFAHRL